MPDQLPEACTNPVAGDEVTKGKKTRIVQDIFKGLVYYRADSTQMMKKCSLAAWRRWCRDADKVRQYERLK